MSKRSYVYVQAIVDTKKLEVDGPGAIRFLDEVVYEDSESKAYLLGQRLLNTKAKKSEIINDYVIFVGNL